MKQFVVIELTYDTDSDYGLGGVWGVGLMGVFDEKSKAIEEIRRQVTLLGTPDEDYDGGPMFAIPVDYDGHWVDAVNNPDAVKFWMEFVYKEVELNQSLQEAVGG